MNVEGPQVFRGMKHALMVLCLALPMLAQTPGVRNAQVPSAFARDTGSGSASSPISGHRLSRLHAIWAQPGRAASFGLLFVACLCLAALEWKVLRRRNNKQSRLAETLSEAVRSGILAEEEPRQPAAPLWSLWKEPEPCDAVTEPEKMMSRYRLVGYHPGEPETATDVPVVTVRQIGGPDPNAPLTEDELIRGIPREFLNLRPESSDAPPPEPPTALLETAAVSDPATDFRDLDLAAFES
jgi:hypothetical protein